jgi:Flp pilus assembly protein TadG
MRMRTMRETTRGSVIVECALLIPMILMIAMCGAEFTRCLRAVKIAQALSEEAANLAYRECSSLRTLQVTRCLEDAQQQVSAFALTIDNVGPRNADSSYVWIKVFVNNPGNAPYFAESRPAGVNPTGNCRGRDQITNTRPVQCAVLPDRVVPNSFIASQNVVVVAVAFVRYYGIGPIARLFGYSPGTGTIGANGTGFFNDTTII